MLSGRAERPFEFGEFSRVPFRLAPGFNGVYIHHVALRPGNSHGLIERSSIVPEEESRETIAAAVGRFDDVKEQVTILQCFPFPNQIAADGEGSFRKLEVERVLVVLVVVSHEPIPEGDQRTVGVRARRAELHDEIEISRLISIRRVHGGGAPSREDSRDSRAVECRTDRKRNVAKTRRLGDLHRG